MYSMIRRFFRKLPFLHKSLEQDLYNPLQRDRLPDTRNIELEFPVVSGSLEQNRRLVRRWVSIALFVSFLLAIVEYFFTQTFFQRLINLVAVVGFLFVWLSYLAVRRPRFRWFLVWIVTPHVVLALLVIKDPSLAWLTGGLMAVLVADLFATH